MVELPGTAIVGSIMHGRTEELLERGRWQQQERVMGPVQTETFGSIMSVQRSYWSEAVGNNKNV